MYKLEEKYRIPNNIIDLKVVDILEFQDYPILTLEKDKLNQKYISYLINNEEEVEIRAILPVSENRLKQFLSGEVELEVLYKKSETGSVFIFCYSVMSGEIKDSFFLTIEEFIMKFQIGSYFIINNNPQEEIKDREVTASRILVAKQKNKILIDIFIESQDLVNNIKIWAIRRIMEPALEIVKSMVDISNKELEQKVAFSNLIEGSLGFTIEISNEWTLFDNSTEIDKIEKIIELFSANSKEEFLKVLESTTNEKYIREYSKIVNTLIDKNVVFSSALIDPKKDYIRKVTINKSKAILIKKVLSETFPDVTDVEEIIGIFLEIDMHTKEPMFTIESITEEAIFRGKIIPSVLEKLIADKVNIGKVRYTFTIKTIYSPATPFRSEKLKSYLIDYKN